MSDTYSVRDVTQDLAFLLTLTGIVSADDQGFWHNDLENERYVHKLDAQDEGHHIALFQSTLPKGDHYYFNPFSEGFGKKSPATQLFLKMVRVNCNIKLRAVLLWMVIQVLEHKRQGKDAQPLQHGVLRMVSASVDKKQTLYDVIDEAMLDEFTKIIERMDTNILQVPYLIQQMTAKVTCETLTDNQWDEKYGGGARKKSLIAFKQAVMGVLGIASPADLAQFTVKYDPDMKTAASLYTVMSVYLKVYHRFNDVLAQAYAIEGVPQPAYEINLGELAQVIERFPQAYTIAKHMPQTVLPSVPATSTQTVDTSKLTMAKSTGNRFAQTPPDPFGRGAATGPLTIGTGNRFAPEIVQEKRDPFAPPVMAAPSSGMGMSGGYFNTSPSFGQSGFGQSLGGGLNLNPPSNFNSPFSRTF